MLPRFLEAFPEMVVEETLSPEVEMACRLFSDMTVAMIHTAGYFPTRVQLTSAVSIMLGATTNWLKISPLEVLITRACDPSVHEPNYAVHLEVAEYINTKKANW
jgi:hypothetical protein